MRALLVCAVFGVAAGFRLGSTSALGRSSRTSLRMSFEDDFTVVVLGDLHLDPRCVNSSRCCL